MSEAGSCPKLVVRPVASASDCLEVVNLTAAAFPEEVRAQGISLRQYRDLEHEDLIRQPHYWPTIGLACEGKKVLGTVVLSFANEEDAGLTYWQYSRRVGCIPTLLTLAYDHVLEEPLLAHECLIDFIAVAPEARGKGVGAALMAWAEKTGAELLAQRAPADIAAQGGGCLTLWVAADNATACRLYQRSGYATVKRTDQGACNCIMSRVFKRFLGHAVWCKMSKRLVVPEGLATVKPEAQAIRMSASAGPPEEQFVMVALESEDAEPVLPPSNGKRSGRKAALELSTTMATASTSPTAAAAAGASPTHIAAHGGGLESEHAMIAIPTSPTAALSKVSSVKECAPLQLFGGRQPGGAASQAGVGAAGWGSKQSSSGELPLSQQAASPRSRQGSAATEVGLAGLLRTISAGGTPLVAR